MDERLSISVLAACVTIWIVYQIVKTNVSPKDTYLYYLSKPKNQISVVTLLAILAYTVLTQSEVNAAQQQAAASDSANEISHEALTAETRAWINFNIDSVSLNWNDPRGPTIETLTTFTNEGSSPALDVTNVMEFVIGNPFVRQSDVAQICSTMENPVFSSSLFMKDTFRADDKYSQSVAAIRNEEDEFARQHHIPGGHWGVYDPTVVLCANYKIVGDDRWHHTGRAFILGFWQTFNGERAFLNPGDGMSLPAGVAELQPAFDSDYTN